MITSFSTYFALFEKKINLKPYLGYSQMLSYGEPGGTDGRWRKHQMEEMGWTKSKRLESTAATKERETHGDGDVEHVTQS